MTNPLTDEKLAIAREYGEGYIVNGVTVADLVAEIDRLRADLATVKREAEEAKRAALTDDPEMDATDFAHPAWWRGNDAGVSAIVDRVTDILDGTDKGEGVLGWAPLEAMRRRLLAAREAMGKVPHLTLDEEENRLMSWLPEIDVTNTMHRKVECVALGGQCALAVFREVKEATDGN